MSTSVKRKYGAEEEGGGDQQAGGKGRSHRLDAASAVERVDNGACDDEGELNLALKHFEDALGMIENKNEGKRCYLEALSRCPSVVQNESPPELFLWACGWDPWQAAQRIAEYWKERVDLFGWERAFFPMTAGLATTSPGTDAGQRAAHDDNVGENMSGTSVTSALDQQDVEVLETGSVQVLPPDREGRTVIYMDRSRLEPRMHHMTRPRLRALWYILQRAILQKSSVAAGKSGSTSGYSVSGGSGASQHRRQPNRIVFLALACRPPASGYDWEFPK